MIGKAIINCITYVCNGNVVHRAITRLRKIIGSLIFLAWNTVLKILELILRQHKTSWQCISWIICARNINSWIWWLKIKWVTLMTLSNYKPQSRIIGRFIFVTNRLKMIMMMHKVNTRRINIMHLI